MVGYFALIFLIIILILYSKINKEYGFKELKIERNVKDYRVEIGEDIFLTTIIENNKWLPISFLHVEEKLPKNLVTELNKEDIDFFIAIKGYERAKKNIKIRAEKRGVYLLKGMRISLGDVFGFNLETKDIEDYKEIVVYPKIISLEAFNIESNNLQGENIIKRWIYQDPIFIKGIREYNVEDRMKDIHWPTSLRMDKLMVREYDYSSDRELVVIFNAQGGIPFYKCIDEEIIEKGISITISIINEISKMGLPIGLWTNANIASYNNEFKNKVEPFVNSYEKILELCGRITLPAREDFSAFLSSNLPCFRKNAVYIIIASFLDEASISSLYKLNNVRMSIKLIDISRDSSLPNVSGIEKLILKGEERDGTI